MGEKTRQRNETAPLGRLELYGVRNKFDPCFAHKFETVSSEPNALAILVLRIFRAVRSDEEKILELVLVAVPDRP